MTATFLTDGYTSQEQVAYWFELSDVSYNGFLGGTNQTPAFKINSSLEGSGPLGGVSFDTFRAGFEAALQNFKTAVENISGVGTFDVKSAEFGVIEDVL